MQERNDSFEELRANLLEKLRNQGCSHDYHYWLYGTNATAFSNG